VSFVQAEREPGSTQNDHLLCKVILVDLRTTGGAASNGVAATAFAFTSKAASYRISSCVRAEDGRLGICSRPEGDGFLAPILLLGAGDGARSPAALSAEAVRELELMASGLLSTEVPRVAEFIAGNGPALREPEDGLPASGAFDG